MGRKLLATDARDKKVGALLGVYHHLGKGVKTGASYNFTQYSAD
jgi:hypothetical protein